MKLNDVRKLAVRQRMRVSFVLSNGHDCVVNEQGVGKVPTLKSKPQFDIEEEFASAHSFVLESLDPGAPRRPVTRRDLEKMVAHGPTEADDPHDHDE